MRFRLAALADSANTYNLTATSFKPGDFMVERLNLEGIGHMVVIKEVTELESEVEIDGLQVKQREAEIISGSMPRRQGKWESSTAALFYFLSEVFGGQSTVEFGAGLRRFRSAVVVGGKWTNVVLDEDGQDWISTDDPDALVERQTHYLQLMPELDPERIVALKAKVDSAREWLRENPSSCSRREVREKIFKSMYEAGEELGMTKEQVDKEHRILDDYVFANLKYDESKTCCWNSTTEEMYRAIIEYNECRLGERGGVACEAIPEADRGMCQPPLVFKGRVDGSDGYQVFEDYARVLGAFFLELLPKPPVSLRIPMSYFIRSTGPFCFPRTTSLSTVRSRA
jgi:hypothetical protein